MAYQRILVPVDGSGTSKAGLEEAVKLARLCGGELRLLHVMDVMPLFSVRTGGAALDKFIEGLAARGKALLEESARVVSEAGVNLSTHLYEGVGHCVADVITGEAKRCGAELIVMGTHGRRGVSRLLVGSDAELVLRNSPVPVLLVRAPARSGRAVKEDAANDTAAA